MDMKIPFPADPEKWQAAYTADNAYYDAGEISSTAALIGTASLVMALLFSIIFLFSKVPAKQYLFSLDSGFANMLDESQLTNPIREAFQNQGKPLTANAIVVVQQAGNEWVINDINMQYLIQNEQQTLKVYAKQNGLIAFLFSKIPAKQYLFSLASGSANTLDASRLTNPVREAFQNQGKPLTANATVVVQQAGSEWVINNANTQYFIRNEQQTLNVYAKQNWLIALIAFVVMVIIAILISEVFKQVKKIAFHHAGKFFGEFYLPPESINALEVINYRLGNRIKLPMPFSEWFTSISQFKYILVQNGEILKKNDWPAWLACNIGGPILLIVFDGSALYIERGNRFSRVVGPGVSFLERYETIKYAVDLRTKVKSDSIAVWTKDGITIKLTISINYRIGDPQKISTKPQLIYPFDPVAVKKAIERYSLRWPDPLKEPGEFTWEDAAWGQVTGIVPDYIGSRFLDDLLVADRKGGQILASESTQKIFDSLNSATNGFGVYVTDFQILSIEVPPEVEEYYVQYWKAERQSFATILDGKAKAFNIRTREKVRANAQHDLILAIADGLKKNENGRLTEALLLSLSEVLDHGLNDPNMRGYTAKETLETLEKLQNMLEKPASQNMLEKPVS